MVRYPITKTISSIALKARFEKAGRHCLIEIGDGLSPALWCPLGQEGLDLRWSSTAQISGGNGHPFGIWCAQATQAACDPRGKSWYASAGLRGTCPVVFAKQERGGDQLADLRVPLTPLNKIKAHSRRTSLHHVDPK